MRWYKNKSLLFYNYINGDFIGNYLENKIDIYNPSMTKKLDKKINKKDKKNENTDKSEKVHFIDFNYDNKKILIF